MAEFGENLPEGWSELTRDEVVRITAELASELCLTHALNGLALTAVARRDRRDDFLFRREDGQDGCFVVHLTWRKESSADWPYTTQFSSLDDFSANWRRILE
jgi:hypothetical protein